MDWVIWQLADSGFPAGAFAHSFGLEAAVHHGAVDAGTLPAFVRDTLDQTGHGALPFLTAAHAAPEALAMVDAHCDAFLRNVVANRASRTQGRAWMATIERTFPQPAVHGLCAQARAAHAQHHALLVGATLRTLGVGLDAAQRLLLFGVCRGTLSAAVRLGLAGTTDAQRLLAESAGDLDRTLARCAGLGIGEATQVAPLLDLWQSAHDRLYSRLFQS